MDVVDRYLQNVRSYLPGKAQDDFVAELGENIRSQVEDREEQLGRPLTEDERVAILRAHGHPFLVAGAYRSDGRRLVLGREVIGPALFPFYRLALIAVGTMTLLVLAFGSAANVVGGRAPIPALRTAFFQLSLLVTIATVVFAALDAHFRRTAQTWDPRRLPSRVRSPVSPTTRRVQAAIQVAATLAFLWFWVVPVPVGFARYAAAHDMQLGPAWGLLHLGLTISTVLSLVTPALTAFQPDWHRFRWLVSLFSTGAFIAFATAALWSRDWLLPLAGLDPLEAREVARLCLGIGRGIGFGLGLGVVVTALSTVYEVVRGAWKEYRRGGTSHFPATPGPGPTAPPGTPRPRAAPR